MANTHQTINPATEEVIQTFDITSDAQAREIVTATHEAFLEWRQTDFDERADILRAIAKLLRKRKENFIALMTPEMGKPITQSNVDIELCAAICEYTADNAATFLADEQRSLQGVRALLTYQPFGVIFGIQPWNFPLYQVFRYSIANIMAGNSVLLNHAP